MDRRHHDHPEDTPAMAQAAIARLSEALMSLEAMADAAGHLGVRVERVRGADGSVQLRISARNPASGGMLAQLLVPTDDTDF